MNPLHMPATHRLVVPQLFPQVPQLVLSNCRLVHDRLFVQRVSPDAHEENVQLPISQ